MQIRDTVLLEEYMIMFFLLMLLLWFSCLCAFFLVITFSFCYKATTAKRRFYLCCHLVCGQTASLTQEPFPHKVAVNSSRVRINMAYMNNTLSKVGVHSCRHRADPVSFTTVQHRAQPQYFQCRCFSRKLFRVHFCNISVCI